MTGRQQSDADTAAAVVRAARIVSAEGLIEAFGHVGARLRDGAFLLTPRQGLTSVTERDLVLLEVTEASYVAFHLVDGDPTAVPVEAAIHAAIFAARGDVGGIVRDHGPASTVFGVTRAPLAPVHAFGAVGPDVVPVHDTPALVRDRKGGRDLVEVLGAASAVLMRGNGRVVVGSSVEEACARAILLEESARVSLAARAAGLEPRVLTLEEQARAREEVASPAQLRRVWNHYCAKHAALLGSAK